VHTLVPAGLFLLFPVCFVVHGTGQQQLNTPFLRCGISRLLLPTKPKPLTCIDKHLTKRTQQSA
jgi:hypothetical protein